MMILLVLCCYPVMRKALQRTDGHSAVLFSKILTHRDTFGINKLNIADPDKTQELCHKRHNQVRRLIAVETAACSQNNRTFARHQPFGTFSV